MSTFFKTKDIMHKIVVKFILAFLPNAKKRYYARAVMQPELDIDGIASKAEVYDIATPPQVIKDGLVAACLLIAYLIADGYKIILPILHMKTRVPGEYDGYETHLPDGAYPEISIYPTKELREYIKNNVQIIFDGVEETNGLIAVLYDEATGTSDEVITMNNFATLRGYGLKIESDAEHANQVGLFLVDPSNTKTKVSLVAINEPKTMKFVVPATLTPNIEYKVLICTQSNVRNGSQTLKQVREMISEFSVTAKS